MCLCVWVCGWVGKVRVCLCVCGGGGGGVGGEEVRVHAVSLCGLLCHRQVCVGEGGGGGGGGIVSVSENECVFVC